MLHLIRAGRKVLARPAVRLPCFFLSAQPVITPRKLRIGWACVRSAPEQRPICVHSLLVVACRDSCPRKKYGHSSRSRIELTRTLSVPKPLLESPHSDKEGSVLSVGNSAARIEINGSFQHQFRAFPIPVIVSPDSPEKRMRFTQ